MKQSLCPHCLELHTDRVSDETAIQPCQGCEEFNEKLEQIVQADEGSSFERQ